MKMRSWMSKECPHHFELLREWDQQRELGPLSEVEGGGWAVLGAPEAIEVLDDHKRFSSRVSHRLTVPGGVDPPEHTFYRAFAEFALRPDRVEGFVPAAQELARRSLQQALATRESATLEIVGSFAKPFSVKVLCLYLGWPLEAQETLLDWVDRQYEATGAGDRAALESLGREFDQLLDELFRGIRADPGFESASMTGELLAHRIGGRGLTDQELRSLLRNFTVGEVGSVSASIGLVLAALAEDEALQQRYREDPLSRRGSVETVLRLAGPLLSNRRVVTADTILGEQRLQKGDRLSLLWPAIGRDERLYGQPMSSLDTVPEGVPNLLWGYGIHVCPGASLAHLVIGAAVEAVLQVYVPLRRALEHRTVEAVYPSGGYREYWIAAPLVTA